MRINIIRLNTMSRLGPHRHQNFFEDPGTHWEKCEKCGYYLFSSSNYFFDKMERKITQLLNETHLELCEGDPYKTLVKVEQTWKENVVRANE